MLPLISIASSAATAPSNAHRNSVALFGQEDTSEASYKDRKNAVDTFDRLFLIKDDMTDEEIRISRQQLSIVDREMRRYALHRQETLYGDTTYPKSSRPRLY